MHPPSDPLFRTLLARSSDEGRTWSDPSFVPDFDWSGVEVPGIATLSDGTVVLTQFRFGWYPLGLARQRHAAGEPISLCLPDVGFTEHFTDADWKRSRHTWARGYHGLYAHLSTDRGHTFEHTSRIDTAPYRNGFTRVGVTQLADGRVAYAVTEHHPPTSRHTYLLFSGDGCQTWEAPVLLADTPEGIFGEPDIVELASSELYCILRCGQRVFMHGCRSIDGGRTWSTPEPTTIDGHPGHLTVLQDGRLLCSYGRRKEPFGIRLSLSEDGGRTWQTDREIVVRNDLPNGDLGYPTTVEYAANRLFVRYYGQEADGVTCVQGTFVSLA